MNQFFKFIVLGITILVMAVPEGLPMAVTISLAYSVEKMRKLQNLVRKMDACETMGSITDICSDKTGTLTENQMTVVDIYSGGMMASVGAGVSEKLKKDPDLIDMCHIAAINSSATPDFSKNLREQKGNKTEMALLDFAKQIGVDYNNVRKLDNILNMVPFSSSRKKMLTLYKKDDGTTWLYSKGAPENVLTECGFYRSEGKTYRVEQKWKEGLFKNILKVMNDKMERTIAVAKVQVDNYKEDDDLFKYDKEMTFVGVFGIMDPVRNDVPRAVKLAQGAKIVVRMVTGDNTQIGAAIARECGILSKDYVQREDEQDDQVMDGKTFREKVGDLQWKEEEKDGKIIRVPYVKDMHAFQKLEPKLRVIGRCLPTDKLLLVTGLQTLGRVVSVTGDGANDAPALKKADVGLGMGKTGTDICKDASKIVLLDDNFSSIITAVKFGRNIFDAIRKFMKFQLTVNLVAMAIAISCGFIIKESPINAIQMLWVNVIMDSFSALALATEPPTDELLLREPVKKRDPIINRAMWNAICFQAVCQFILLVIVLTFTPRWLGIKSSIGMEVFSAENALHYTFFFNVFVFLQVFNFINARVLRKTELNPFQDICSNPIFWVIIALTVVGQIIFVQMFGRPVRCTPLPLNYHIISMAIGSLALVFAFIEKNIPDQYLPFPMMIKEKEEVTKESLTKGIMSMTGMGPYRPNRSSIIR